MDSAMYSHILIPTDGSALAAGGVHHGISLAKALGAKVTAVAVSEPFIGMLLPGEPEPTFRMTNAEVRQAAEKAAKKLLAAVSDEARSQSVACDVVHVHDRFPAAEAILDTANERGCDLIVMASHGRRGIQRALLGSQAFEVVTRAKVPVLIVR
jgi:nucleotide-binding universal stress UspA family protein